MSSINFPNVIVTSSVYTTTSTSNGWFKIINTIPKKKYNVLGKEIEVEGYQDLNLSLILSLINTLGIRFYIETKKNSINLPTEIENILEEEVKSYSRNKTIENFLEEEVKS